MTCHRLYPRTGNNGMRHNFTQRTRRLIERARWKDEGWDKPTPPEILERYARDAGVHAFHLSELGPGGKVTSPADLEGTPTDPKPAGGFKVGINPQYSFNTPAGVYGYPLNKTTYANRLQKARSELPRDSFATERPWMYILEATADGVSVDGPRSSGWDRNRALEAIADLAASEPDMVRELVDGPVTPRHELRERLASTRWVRQAERQSRLDDPFSLFFEAAALAAFKGRGGRGGRTWGRLLREYGDIGYIEDLGTRLIDTEAKQTVFLHSTAFESVDVVENIWDWRNAKREREREARMHRARQVDDIFEAEDVLKAFGPNSGIDPDVLNGHLDDHPWIGEWLMDAASASENADGTATLHGERDFLEVRGAVIPRLPLVILEGDIIMKWCRVDGAVVTANITKIDNPVLFQTCHIVNSTVRVSRETIEEFTLRHPDLFGDASPEMFAEMMLESIVEDSADPSDDELATQLSRDILKASAGDIASSSATQWENCELKVT